MRRAKVPVWADGRSGLGAAVASTAASRSRQHAALDMMKPPQVSPLGVTLRAMDSRLLYRACASRTGDALVGLKGRHFVPGDACPM